MCRLNAQYQCSTAKVAPRKVQRVNRDQVVFSGSKTVSGWRERELNSTGWFHIEAQVEHQITWSMP